MLATFVGNNSWFGVLLALHIGGAIIGLGPTFGFGIMAATAKKLSPERAIGILEATHAVEVKLSTPILIAIQLTSGVLLIFNRGFNHGFFSHQRAWLLAGIAIFIAAMGIATAIMTPSMSKMLELANAGSAGTPEFEQCSKKLDRFGPILGILGIAIVVLMIWRPGSGCSVPGIC